MELEHSADIEEKEEGTPSSRADYWQQYQRLIKQTPLLTEEQEQELGKQILLGHRAIEQLKEIEKNNGANSALADPQLQEREVKAAIRTADKAKRQLVEHNLRLAAWIAMKFRSNKIAMMDLIQDANIALMKAAENWDYGAGKRFGYVAQLYVKQALTESCYKVGGFHIPKSVASAIRRIEAISTIVKSELGYTDDYVIARELNVPVLTVKQLRSAARNTQSTISLDSPLGDNDERTLADTISAPCEDSPELIICDAVLHEKMVVVLGSLEPIEEKVIRLRFGFEDGATHSQEDVGRLCGTSCEVIQLAEARALRKLRHPSRSGQLTGLL